MIHAVLEPLHDLFLQVLSAELSFGSETCNVKRYRFDCSGPLGIEANRNQEIIAVLLTHVIGALHETSKAVGAEPFGYVAFLRIQNEDRRVRPQMRRNGAQRKIDLEAARQRLEDCIVCSHRSPGTANRDSR